MHSVLYNKEIKQKQI